MTLIEKLQTIQADAEKATASPLLRATPLPRLLRALFDLIREIIEELEAKQ